MKDYNISHQSERKSKQYEEVIYGANSYDSWLWRWEESLLLKELSKLRGRLDFVRYLDFACGTGRITAALEERVNESTGIDIAPDMLAFARTKLKRTILVEGDLVTRDALVGGSFDLITAFRFFLNAQPQLRDSALRVLSAKLSDDGILIFNIHGNTTSYRFFAKLWYRLRGRQLNTMTIFAARALAHHHGLVVVHWYGFGILPKVVYRFIRPMHAFKIDKFFSRMPLAKYIAYDLVFVCRRS